MKLANLLLFIIIILLMMMAFSSQNIAITKSENPIEMLSLLVAIIGLFSTILLILIGALTWKNFEIKAQSEKDLLAIRKLHNESELQLINLATQQKEIDSINQNFIKLFQSLLNDANFMQKQKTEFMKLLNETRQKIKQQEENRQMELAKRIISNNEKFNELIQSAQIENNTR